MNPSLVEYSAEMMGELPRKNSFGDFDDDERSLEDLLKDPDLSALDPDDLLSSPLFDDSGDKFAIHMEKLDTIPSERNLNFNEPTSLIKTNLPEVSPASYRETTIELDEDDIIEAAIYPIEYTPSSLYEPDPLPPVNIDSNGFPVQNATEEHRRASSSEAFYGQPGYVQDQRIGHGSIGRNGPPIQSSNTSMEMDHINSNFHNIQLAAMDANTSSDHKRQLGSSGHTPPRRSPQRQSSDPTNPPVAGDVHAYNEAMEKLCESMKRSAMSRSLVKQLSGRNLIKQGSSRSLNKQGSARNLIKQGSQRSLISDHSGHRSTPGYFPARRSSIDTKHRIGREAYQGRPMPGRGAMMRQHSNSGLGGSNRRLGAMIQMDSGSRGGGSFHGVEDSTVHSG